MACSAVAANFCVLITTVFNIAGNLCAQEASVDRFDRVAAVLSTLKDDKRVCTAFFIEHRGRYLMVSANHASLETNPSTEILLPSKGEPRLIRLAEMTKVEGANPWIVHRSADLAVCELDLSKLNEPLAKQLKCMCISSEYLDRVLPPRSSRIECIGFAMGLGVEANQISALAMTCYVASESLFFDGRWGKESVFYASPAVGAGASGGLVTLYDESPKECRVIGIIAGFNGDESGAKLVRAVPASVLLDFIDSEVK